MAGVRPVPVEDDRDTAGFWEAARRRVLVVRACTDCGAVLHMPTARCGYCGSWEGQWKPVAPTGRLHSWTNVVHQVHQAFEVPYTVVLVELDDAPDARLVGYLPGTPELKPEQAMEVEWQELEDGTVLPQWRAVS